MFSMNRSTFAPVAVATLASMLAMPSTAQGQQAVQWRVEDGGNGHWYVRLVRTTESWDQLSMAAQSAGGHLASISSASENSFVRSVNGNNNSAIGGSRSGGDCATSWGWSDGSVFSYSNWDYDQPYCGSTQWGPEEVIVIYGSGVWHDYPRAGYIGWWTGYIIEWSSDCDSDGLVDYGQILDGTREDTNANGIPDCCEGIGSCEPCRSDLNNDDRTDAADISVLLGFWGLTGKSVLGDIDGNGQVDAADLSALLAGWGKCP